MNKAMLMLAGALAAAPLAAVAQTTSTTTSSGTTQYYAPWQAPFWNYLGLSVGQSSYDTDCVPGFGCDDKDLGVKLYGGGKFNPYFGLQLSYVHLGDADAGGGHTRAQGATLSLTGEIPLATNFEIDGRIGGVYGWTKTSGDAPFYNTGSDNGLNFTWGGGAGWQVNRNWQVRVDYDRYRFDFANGSRDVDLVSAGVRYSF